MTNAILVQTTQGGIYTPVVHKNGALQVIRRVVKEPEEYVFYNTVHDNGLRLPNTDADDLDKAILICDWCAKNFPEFAKTDLDMADVSVARQEEFKQQLWDFKFLEMGWADDDY